MKIFYKSNRFGGLLKPLATLILLFTFFINVNAQAPAKPVVSGNNNVCVTSVVTYSTPVIGTLTYAWTVNSAYGIITTTSTNAGFALVSVKWNIPTPNASIAWVKATAYDAGTALSTISDPYYVMVNPTPQERSLSTNMPDPSTASYCHASDGVTLTLLNSQKDITYSLFRFDDNSQIGLPITSNVNGSNLTFPNVKVLNNALSSEETSSFYVYAINPSSACNLQLASNVTLTKYAEITAPIATNITKNYDGTPAIGSVNSTPVGHTLVWYANATGNTLAAAPSITNVGSQTTYAVFKNSTTGCESARTPVTVIVNPLTINVTATAGQSKVYGSTDPTFAYTFTPALIGSDAFTGSLARTAGENVGNAYAINQGTLALSTNYTLVYNSANFAITKKTITVTAIAGQSKVYGSTDPTLAYTFTPALVVGDAFTGALARATGENVGTTYLINQGTLALSTNYTLVYNSSNFAITKKTITVTATAGQSKVYGSTDPTFAYTFTPALVVGDAFTGALARTAGENVGNAYAINQGTLVLSTNYTLVYNSSNFAITKKTITVTATAGQSKVYGSTDPTFAYTFTPALVVGDAFTGALARTAGENVGNAYAINQGTLALSTNYTLVYNSSNFAITAKTITVTATAGQSKVYGSTDPTFAYTFTPALVVGDAFTGALARTAGENVGNAYAINQGTLALSTNYTLVYNSSNFAITKKTITVTATAGSKVFGEADPDPFLYTFTPALVVGDAFTGKLSRDIGEAYGNYSITIGTLALSPNYTLMYNNANFAITKKILTITAENKTKVYNGQPYSGFTVSYSGFNSGDSEASLTGTLSFSGAAISATDVGSHVITPYGLSSTNYNIIFVNGNLSITPLTINVTATAGQSKVYGSTDPTFAYTFTPALVVGDAFTGALARTAGENVGNAYAINQGTLALSPNYTLVYNSANFAITKKTITVTANSGQTKVYGNVDPLPFTYTFTPALVVGDAFTGALARTAGENVGNAYAINQGTLALSTNYTLVYNSANFAITKKTITVTTTAGQSKVYGSTDPTLAYTFTPALVVGDAFTGALARTAGENVGNAYAINQGTLALSTNYTLVYNSANFAITAKTITVTATAGQSKVYGSTDPTLAYTFTPALVVGDAFTGALARTAGENVGTTYLINQGTLTLSPNYTLVYNSANFAITAKTITVTANSGQTKVYGNVDPLPFTYTFTPALIVGDVFTGTLARTAGENVGNAYAINQGTLALSSNYTLVYNSANFSITKKMVTPIVTANDKCFDGSNIATLSSQTLTGVLGADVVILNVASASFATSTPGMQTVIASGLTLSGASAGNYMLSSLTAATNAEIYELPAPVIAGASSSCPNVTTPYFDTDISGGTYTYQWTVSGGIIQYGANTDQIQVIWNNNYTSGWLKLTKTNTLTGCIYTTAEYPVIINTLPAPVITGLNAVSENQAGVTYTTPSVTNHLYSWFVVGGNIVAGQGTNSITVNWSNAGTGSVAVTQTSASSCETTYSMNVSIQALGYTISGYVNYDNTYNTALNGVTVNLKNAQGIVIGTAVTAPNFGSTGQSGYYSIANIPAGNYTLGAQYNGTLGGNNATDALAIQLNILGSYPLTGVKAIAADVNMSGGISSLDALYIKLRTIGTINTYPAGNWKFEEFSITVSTADIAQNIKGLCVGDVNGSYIPNMLKSTSDINSISDNTIKIQNGKSFNYDIKSASLSNLGAVTLIMNYNDNLFEIENVTSSLKDVKYVVNNGQVSIAWSDVMGNSFKNEDAIISLQMKAKQSIEKAIEIFTISNESEFADITANRIGNVNLKLSKVITENENGFSVNNYPNPFNQTTNINYTIAEKSSVKITLTNLIGQTIATITQEVKDAGSYNVVVNADALNLEAGIYLYNVEVKGLTSSFIRTNKLVLEK